MRNILIPLLILCISCLNDIKSDSSENMQVESVDSLQNVERITVDLDDVVQDLLMTDFFSDLRYVQFQVPEDEYIGRTEKIIVSDDYVALFDKSQYCVWIFTHQGEYINKVQIPEGRGPGEILHFNDVIITQDNLVRAMGAMKIVVYNIEGEFIEETEYKFFVYKFTFDHENQEYIGYASNSLNLSMNNEHSGKNILFFDNEGKITKSLMPIGTGKGYVSYEVPNNFPVYRNNQRLFSHLENTIYTIKDQNAMPRYHLNFGAHAIPDEVFDRRSDYSTVVYEWIDFWKEEIAANNYVSYLSSFNETESFIHIQFSTEDQ